MQCEICDEDLRYLTEHHCVPTSYVHDLAAKGLPIPKEQPRAYLCWKCHRLLHTIFTNKELAEEMSSVEKLRESLIIAQYLITRRAGEYIDAPRFRDFFRLGHYVPMRQFAQILNQPKSV